jgi:hypothetical protein
MDCVVRLRLQIRRFAMVQGSVAESEVSKPANDETAIRSVMASYNDALNSGSTGAAMALCADDGVFMPPYSQSAVGEEAVRKASNRRCTRITVTADQGLPVGVATPRLFNSAAIALADRWNSSASTGRSAGPAPWPPHGSARPWRSGHQA